jgi:hypothetical protein
MSWIKPNFLWMMYRSGWGTKPGQESVLALRLRRSFFDGLLEQAIETSFKPENYSTLDEWEHALARSSVRMQWDPDHLPSGASLPRRALQLGLKGRVLKDYGRHQILEIIDLSYFVAEPRGNISTEKWAGLLTPAERVYHPANHAHCLKQQLDEFTTGENSG